jgi:hypothetical protein
MQRIEFIRKLIRLLLITLIAAIVFALGSKAVTAKDCSICPGNGKCNGTTDCHNF